MHGEFVQVGAPDDSIPAFNAFALIGKNAKISGSSIGSPEEIRQMLDLAGSHRIKPWIEERPLKHANQTLLDMLENKARYRYVLVNEAHAKQ